MELFELRTIVDETPNADWDDVIEADALFLIRFCIALCLFVFTIGGVLVVLGWLDKLRGIV